MSVLPTQLPSQLPQVCCHFDTHVLTNQCLSGIAACNIGGVTIHSFGGIGLGIDTAENLVKKIRKNKKATARWLRTKVLIIDES